MKIYSIPLALYFLVSISSVSSQGQTSCVGRCGEGYTRSDPCHCDYTCMTYMECCQDFKTVCTSDGSCKGRCHEGFIRGQTCDCDPGCGKFGKCCPDYEESCAQPTQNARPPPSSPDQPTRDEAEKPPEPTTKPKDQVPEDAPEDRIQKDEAMPETAKKDPPNATPKVAQPSKKTTKRSPRRPKTKKNSLSPGEDTEDPYEGKPPSRRPKKKFPKKNKNDQKYSSTKKPRKKKKKIVVEYEDEVEDPNQKPKDKKRPPKKSPKKPKKKKKQVVESEEEIEESEENVSSSSFSSTSSSSSVKGSKTTKKLSRKNQKKNKDDPDNPDEDNGDPTTKDGKPKKPKRPGDEPEDPDAPPKEPNQRDPDDDDKTRKPTIPKEKDGDDPKDTGKPSNEPNQRDTGDDNDKTRKPKTPKEREGDDPDGTGKSPKEPNQKDPDDGKARKPKTPKDKEGDDPEDKGKLPEEPNPKDKKKPKNPSSLETEENVEERTDVNSANADENISTSNQRTKKRSPSSQKKKPRKPGDDTDDPLGKGKKKPDSKKTKKKKGKPTDGDNDPLNPGKGKKQKKKPKKKVDSEEERQETVESEFSSSSSSSSSHTSSKSSSRRLSGKNKKKKNPEPEDPLAPPKRKKDKDSPPTPEPTFKVEGSGDDGSGMDFLSTTRSATTLMVHSTTASQTTKEINQTEATVQPTKSPTESPAVTTEKEKTTTTNILTTKEGTEKTTNAMTTSTQSPTTEERTTEKSTSTEPPPTTTQKSEQAQTTVITESTTTHSDHTIPSESNIKGTSIEPQQILTTKQSVILTTSQPGDESEVSTITSKAENEPTPTKESDDMKMTTKSINPTKTPKPRGSPTNRPLNPEEMENIKPTNPSTTNPYHICDLLKEEAIKLSISDDDLPRVNEICTEMQQLYPLVSTPSPDVKQPDTGDRDIPSSYPHEITPNGNQPPGTRIIQIVDEIYRRMDNSPMANLTGVHSYTIHRPSIWVLLRNKIRSSNDPQKNLCNGQPVDGITTLQNGSMVAFRGHYFWTLNKGGVMGCPRKITEVWGVPSPIDTVFTRCNCGGKTFFFKGSRYWRFSNDMMDQGYPKEIIKGFGGLRGKVNAVLPVAGFRTRPESVYFFKPGGFVQKYTFRQQQAKRCTKKKRPSVQYPINSKNIETVKYRFPRDVVRHRIQIHRSFANVQQPLGMLHEQTTVRLTWRGIPNNIISAVSLPNYKKKDGFDYYVFNKDKYYNINMSSKTAVKPQPGSEQNISKDWYNCKE
ncbi:proteoglycan 4 isoform X5 [Ranitomeya imitator]|uniref:proteoglycan 4 isoform X5 n=1 Tax=Ranitomeya imitator TaxID=111125 RepID=UPI0037E7E047